MRRLGTLIKSKLTSDSSKEILSSTKENEIQCWPPAQEITEDNGTIKSSDLVLPEALYWDFIRPFTPVRDRAIINKRTGSTQFYAGDRIPLDMDYLVKFGER